MFVRDFPEVGVGLEFDERGLDACACGRFVLLFVDVLDDVCRVDRLAAKEPIFVLAVELADVLGARICEVGADPREQAIDAQAEFDFLGDLLFAAGA